MTINQLKILIQLETEYLQTTEGDEHACITLENLEGILSEYFEQPIKLSNE